MRRIAAAAGRDLEPWQVDRVLELLSGAPIDLGASLAAARIAERRRWRQELEVFATARQALHTADAP